MNRSHLFSGVTGPATGSVFVVKGMGLGPALVQFGVDQIFIFRGIELQERHDRGYAAGVQDDQHIVAGRRIGTGRGSGGRDDPVRGFEGEIDIALIKVVIVSVDAGLDQSDASDAGGVGRGDGKSLSVREECGSRCNGGARTVEKISGAEDFDGFIE